MKKEAKGSNNQGRKSFRPHMKGKGTIEGCAVDAIMAADIHVTSANAGLDLLLHPKRTKATLRF